MKVYTDYTQGDVIKGVKNGLLTKLNSEQTDELNDICSPEHFDHIFKNFYPLGVVKVAYWDEYDGEKYYRIFKKNPEPITKKPVLKVGKTQLNRILTCDLWEVKELSKDPANTNAVTEQLSNIWKNLCHHERAAEALSIGYMHTNDTISESQKELRKLTSAKSFRHNIIINQ